MNRPLPPKLFATALLIACGVLAQAQTPVLLADINAGEDDSRPTRFFDYGDLTLFRAGSADAGVELWVTDGTPEGTTMLADLNADPEYSRGNANPDNFIEYNGLVYFKARGDGIGDELYVTDGTPAGTRLVKNIYEETDPSDPESSGPLDFVEYDGLLYFTARTEAESSELWVTDGTTEGTRLAVDINPGGGTGIPNFKTVYNGLLYFSANDGESGAELFRSDGTPEGTELVADVNVGSGNGRVSNFYEFDGRLYFTANDGASGTELYATDGTAEGTARVLDLAPGDENSRPDNFATLADSFLVFSADAGDGEQMYYTTGDSASTVRIADDGFSDVALDPEQFVPVIENVFYFFVAESDDTSRIFTLLLDDLTPTVTRLDYLYEGLDAGDIEDLTFTGSYVYFTYENEESGRELAGFDFVKERNGGALPEVGAGAIDGEVDDIFLASDRLLFEATDGSSGLELYALDAETAYVTIGYDNRALMNGDTIRLDTVAIGDTATELLPFINVGTDTALVDDVRLLNEGSDIAITLTNDALGPFLPPSTDQQAFALLLAPTAEGPLVDSFLVAYTTAEGDGYRKVYVTAEAVVAELVVTETEGDTALASGELLAFVTDNDGLSVTRELQLSNGGFGVLNVTRARLVDGSVFSVSALDASRIARGTRVDLTVTWSRAAGDPLVNATDTLLIETTLPGADSVFRVPLRVDFVNSVVDLGIAAAAAYPNPITTDLQIELAEPLRGEAAWTVTNVSGQRVAQGRWPTLASRATLDLSALPSGTYLFELRAGERGLAAQVVKR